MKSLSFSALSLSAFSILITAGAIAPAAQALPKIDPDFNLQSRRLAEFDARNKSGIESTFKLQTVRLAELDTRNKSAEETQPDDYSQREYPQTEYPQTVYPQSETPTSPQNVTAEQDSIQPGSIQTSEPTAWKQPKPWGNSGTTEATHSEESITEQRHLFLDQRH